MTFQRPNIESMQGYTPGEQSAETRVIKLNTNENPYPPSPAVADALAAIDARELRRYPPPLAMAFRRVAAELHGLGTENIIATNGGDELLRLVLTTFVDPDETVVVAKPSYSLYPVLTAVQGCQIREVPLQADWQLPNDFSTHLQDAKLCILVNPHAPSGSLMSVDQLRAVAKSFAGLLLIDEAYVDFIAPEIGYDSISLLQELDNVLILRTLSKGYSLAGLRYGYGLGPEALIAPMLYKTRDSYNLDFIAQRLATAALEDVAYARDTWERVRESRQQLANALADLGMPASPSHSNFLLCQVPEKPGAQALYTSLKEQNILVRYFDHDGLRDKLRISIGTDAENSALLAAIKPILAG